LYGFVRLCTVLVRLFPYLDRTWTVLGYGLGYGFGRTWDRTWDLAQVRITPLCPADLRTADWPVWQPASTGGGIRRCGIATPGCWWGCGLGSIGRIKAPRLSSGLRTFRVPRKYDSLHLELHSHVPAAPRCRVRHVLHKAHHPRVPDDQVQAVEAPLHAQKGPPCFLGV